MSKIISVNGILSNGSQSTDLLADELTHRGQDVTQYEYKRVGLLDVAFNLRKGQKRGLQYDRARSLAEISSFYDKPTVIAHSFGALLTLRAMELGAEFGKVFLYRAAMERDMVIPIWGCDEMHIIYHPQDRAIKFGAILTNHSFGRMGVGGSQYAPPEGKDHRLRNYRSQFNGHSGDFREGLSYTADFIVERLR